LGSVAIEALFKELHEETRLDQLIIISSSRPNNIDDIAHLRSKRGEEYWNFHEFPLTNFDEQLNNFKTKRVPVHCCQINSDHDLRHINVSTGGRLSVLSDNC
jgi:hypothetical protein